MATEAKIYNMAAWKAAHPPALIFWQHGIQSALAWQQLWLNVIYGPSRK